MPLFTVFQREKIFVSQGEQQCSTCTTFDVALRNAALQYNMEPASLPASVASILSTVIGVKVTNGTISGLSRVQQRGDVVIRLDGYGAYIFLNLTLTNLTLTLVVEVNAFFATFEALVSATISAILVVEVAEKNDTLSLEEFVLTTTQPVDVNVKPIGAVSSFATTFLPTSIIEAVLRPGLEPLAKVFVKKALEKLHKFAHSDLPFK
ncbi:hypothetical protein V5799_013366 [Amblyomma americanum]|uniref:Uncharacterized protein n=1 Tax=Amblyomma americanum TaxID=6943 RepID=A0AAQ4E646_AMBAM